MSDTIYARMGMHFGQADLEAAVAVHDKLCRYIGHGVTVSSVAGTRTEFIINVSVSVDGFVVRYIDGAGVAQSRIGMDVLWAYQGYSVTRTDSLSPIHPR